MNDQKLRITPVHASDEFQGAVFGIETGLFAWVALASLAGMGMFAWEFFHNGRDLVDAIQWPIFLVLGVVAYLRLGLQGKPPGYTFDLLDSIITRGNAMPPKSAPIHPFCDV